MTHHSKRQPWSAQRGKGARTRTAHAQEAAVKWTEALSQHGRAPLTLHTWHLSPLCTQKGGGPTATPHLWQGSLCRTPLCQGAGVGRAGVLKVHSQELKPSRDGPGLLCGRQAQGPSLGGFQTHSAPWDASAFCPPSPECPCFISISRVPHYKEKGSCCTLEQFQGGGL